MEKMVNRKIKVRGSTLPKVDHAKVAAGLGAESYPSLRQLTRNEARQYLPLGDPVEIPAANPAMPPKAAESTFLGHLYLSGSKMLGKHGQSIDDVFGYRILDTDEEPEFRQQCGDAYATVVRYYAQKQ